MDNTEAKKVSLEEVTDDALENVTGGSDTAKSLVCKRCGATENVFTETQLCLPCRDAQISENSNGYLPMPSLLAHFHPLQNAEPNPANNNPDVLRSVAKNQ